MKVIIAGAGDIGIELAKRLTMDNHDVVVLEKDSEKIIQITNSLDVMVVQEQGERISALIDAGIQDADVFIAVTDSDELNIMFCMIAKKLSNIKTVARVRNKEYSDSSMMISSEQLGIDIMIDPERLAALEIVKLIKTPEASELEFFAGGKIELIAFRTEKDSELIDKPLSSLPVSQDYLIISLVRENGDVIIPKGDDRFLPNDIIYVVKRPGTLTEFGSMARSEKKRIKNVMILGGGKIGFKVAQILEGYKKNNITIKLIEKSADKCKIISDHLTKTLVLNSDAADTNFLKDENIKNVDVLVSVTGSDELNILTAVLGKKLGARKAITEINKLDYEVIMQPLEIDSFVSTRLLVAGKLARLFRNSNILSETFLKDGKIEMIELIVQPESTLINRPLKVLRLSAKGIIIGGILREGRAIIPKGNDVILPQDQLIIFTDPQKVTKVERLFCRYNHMDNVSEEML